MLLRGHHRGIHCVVTVMFAVGFATIRGCCFILSLLSDYVAWSSGVLGCWCFGVHGLAPRPLRHIWSSSASMCSHTHVLSSVQLTCSRLVSSQVLQPTYLRRFTVHWPDLLHASVLSSSRSVPFVSERGVCSVNLHQLACMWHSFCPLLLGLLVAFLKSTLVWLACGIAFVHFCLACVRHSFCLLSLGLLVASFVHFCLACSWHFLCPLLFGLLVAILSSTSARALLVAFPFSTFACLAGVIPFVHFSR